MATTAVRTDSLVAAARAAQEQWARHTLTERAHVLREAQRGVLRHADAIADVVVSETRKPRTEAIANELYAAADHAQWLARNVERVLRDEPVEFTQLHLKTKRASVLYEPLGVVGAITPWNVPFAIPFGVVATAVAAGNAVVLKPSEHAPRAAEWVARVFEEAGAPAGLVQLAPCERESGEALVLELGGRDPMIVFADADLDRTLDGAVFGAFLNAGQACVSAERIYVERPLHDEFARRLRERAAGLRRDEEIAPLVLSGEYREPAVVDGPLPDEELFAPTVAVEPFDGEDDAVRKANDTSFGLAASIWTRDLAKAARVARRIEAGMVWVNDFGYSFAAGQAPWGGVKASGFGRTSGKHGLYECVRVKYVDSDRGRVKPGWWFPYDARTERALRNALDVLYGEGVGRWRAAWRYRSDLLHLGRRARS
jgi:acyl-CoA reductase-like NAD-dependent aldehyde dehydrogenase